MSGVFSIVTEARIAASRGWDRARRAAIKAPAADSPAALARIIEAEILPRLRAAAATAAAFAATPMASAQPANAPQAAAQIAAVHPVAAVPAGAADRLAAAALSEELRPLLARVEALLAGGVPVETAYLELLAPAARRLGEWADAGPCDPIDVAMGLWRLQEIVAALGALAPAPGCPKPADPPVLAARRA